MRIGQDGKRGEDWIVLQADGSGARQSEYLTEILPRPA